ncbi:MAG: endolytic transglycosylase MltG [Patescibacteria group bacterium]
MVELDPEKYHSFKVKNKLVYLVVVLIFVLSGLVASIKYYEFAVNRAAQTVDESTFDIKKGEGISTISENLFSAGLINSPNIFKIYLYLNNLSSKIQAGVYTIPAGTSVVELAELFQHGTNDKSVTLIEGWRVEEFAIKLTDEFENIDYATFVSQARRYEGYLFPDTYSFASDVGAVEVLNKLVSTFETKTEDILTDENLAKAGLTKEEAVIFASILEREVNTNEDMPIVAGILIKRWRNGELIGADATTQYAVATVDTDCTAADDLTVCPGETEARAITWWKSDLYQTDLAYESPYNTRLRAGLPPTPISNPGLASIEAVINHVPTSYNYYLTDADGVTHYAETLEQHNLNISTYL